jgi:hypothetical protein
MPRWKDTNPTSAANSNINLFTDLYKIKGTKAVSSDSVNPHHSCVVLHSEVGQHLQHLWRGTTAH